MLIERQMRCRAGRMAVTARVKRRSRYRRQAAWKRRNDELRRQFVEQLAFTRRNEIEPLLCQLARQD